MALREGLLPTRDLENRIKELHYGMELDAPVARVSGQSIPRVDDCRGLRTDAGTALTFGSHGVRAGTSFNSASTLPETRRSGGCHGTSRGAAFAASIPLSRSLSSSRSEPGCANRVSSRPHDIANDSFVHLLLAVSLCARNAASNLLSTLESVLRFSQTPPRFAHCRARTKLSLNCPSRIRG